MDSVKVEVQLDADSIADFMIYNIYTSAVGIMAIVLGFLNIALVMAFFSRQNYLHAGLFAIFAILILIAFPYYIRKRVKKKTEGSRRVTESVTYEFADEGITTTTSEDSGTASWSKFKKAVARKHILILYADNKQAIILPIAQLGEDYDKIVDIISANMPAPSVRIFRPKKAN